MTIIHTPWSAVIHAGLTGLGFYYHRNVLHTAGIPGLHPLAVGPGIVGLVEPCVSIFFWGQFESNIVPQQHLMKDVLDQLVCLERKAEGRYAPA